MAHLPSLRHGYGTDPIPEHKVAILKAAGEIDPRWHHLKMHNTLAAPQIHIFISNATTLHVKMQRPPLMKHNCHYETDLWLCFFDFFLRRLAIVRSSSWSVDASICFGFCTCPSTTNFHVTAMALEFSLEDPRGHHMAVVHHFNESLHVRLLCGFIFLAESLQITFAGYLEMPVTRQCPCWRSCVSSSKLRTITTF